MQQVEMLALVLVQPLHLDIPQRSGIDGHAGPIPDERGQALLVGGLDLAPGLAKQGILSQVLQARERLLQIQRPLLTEARCEKVREEGIADQQEAAWGNTVGDAVKLRRRQTG